MEPVSTTRIRLLPASFLTSWPGSNAVGVDFGHIVCLDWQARDAGWLADDLVVTCKQSSEDRAAGISIKSTQQVTRAGFPQDFVESAWAQWFGVKTDRKLRETNDAIRDTKYTASFLTIIESVPVKTLRLLSTKPEFEVLELEEITEKSARVVGEREVPTGHGSTPDKTALRCMTCLIVEMCPLLRQRPSRRGTLHDYRHGTI